MPSKKKTPPEVPPVVSEHEREVALEEKEVQIEERKLAVWKQKFEFIKSAGRDTLILITGLVGTVGGGAIRTYLEKLFPADTVMEDPPPPPKPGETHDIMPLPPTQGPTSGVTLTPPDVLFGKGVGQGTGQGYGSGSGSLNVKQQNDYYPQVGVSAPYRHPRNKTLYMMGHGLWIFFMLLVVWGVWKQFRKRQKNGRSTDIFGKPPGTS